MAFEVKFFPGTIGYILFCYQWYKYFKKEENTPRYFNPFIIGVLAAATGFGIFVISNLIGQISHICRGFTIKQRTSIRQKMVDLALQNRSNELDPKYFRLLNFKEKFCNVISLSLFTFLFLSLISVCI